MKDTHTPPYDLIIFDCDGVLVDSEILACEAVIDCLGRYGIDVDFDTVFDRLLGRSSRAIGDYCALLGRPLSPDFYDDLRGSVRAAFAAALKPMPGAATVLENLRTPYCVASSSSLDRMDYSLRLTGLSALVGERLFSAEMVRHSKPAPDLFLHVAAAMGAAPGRTLVVEDSVSGVRAGTAAGMTAWGFVGGSHYAARDGRALLMAAGADRVFDRMADFHRREEGQLDRAVR
jgi:HAD superfamily hydrolase (TIGR01509 family)